MIKVIFCVAFVITIMLQPIHSMAFFKCTIWKGKWKWEIWIFAFPKGISEKMNIIRILTQLINFTHHAAHTFTMLIQMVLFQQSSNCNKYFYDFTLKISFTRQIFKSYFFLLDLLPLLFDLRFVCKFLMKKLKERKIKLLFAIILRIVCLHI